MKQSKVHMSFIFLIYCFIQATPFFSTSAQISESTKLNSAQQGVSSIVLLGTGTPNADPERAGPAVAIVVNETPYLVDCGTGVVRRAAAAFRNGVKGLQVKNLTRVFVTHLHSDHTLGFADLIFTPWILDRDEPLQVYGPEGIRAMTDHISAAYEQDIYLRLFGLEPANSRGYKVDVHEIAPGIVYQDSNVTVEAFLVKHGSWPLSYGFKFITPDRTIVISGDTVPCQSIIDQAKNCDVLIHEVYSQTQFEKLPPAWQNYHSNFHTSSRELAEIATKTKPGLLILYHQLFWGTTEKKLVQEVKKGYRGKVVSGRDLEVY